MPQATAFHRQNLQDLQSIVEASQGPSQVIAIVNGGDAPLVQESLCREVTSIFRGDGTTKVLAHEERQRRGQLLGLLDAVAHWQKVHGPLDPSRVAVGIMMPGQGTRLSPITQRLYGIKPFFPMLVRSSTEQPTWLNAASASLYTWTLVAHHLERLGFRGMAWKWGDEPQIPANRLSSLHMDLSDVDAVRFGAEVEISEDLAQNKEWLHRDPTSWELLRQVRRRSRHELVEALELHTTQSPRALVHVGSPALSHVFIDAAREIFGHLAAPLDIDGYLFEALTSTPQQWERETSRDSGLQGLLQIHPQFYNQAQALRAAVERRRGHSMKIKVLDFGADLYWADIGQLARARDSYLTALEPTAHGSVARMLAGIEHIPPDDAGNRWINSKEPTGHGLRNSIIVDSHISGSVAGEGVVVFGSAIGDGHLGRGSVVIQSAVAQLTMNSGALAFRSTTQHLQVPQGYVHTSIPKTPEALEAGIEDWWAPMAEDVGAMSNYAERRYGNPTSFKNKAAAMRARTFDPLLLERKVQEVFFGHHQGSPFTI